MSHSNAKLFVKFDLSVVVIFVLILFGAYLLKYQFDSTEQEAKLSLVRAQEREVAQEREAEARQAERAKLAREQDEKKRRDDSELEKACLEAAIRARELHQQIIKEQGAQRKQELAELKDDRQAQYVSKKLDLLRLESEDLLRQISEAEEFLRENTEKLGVASANVKRMAAAVASHKQSRLEATNNLDTISRFKKPSQIAIAKWSDVAASEDAAIEGAQRNLKVATMEENQIKQNISSAQAVIARSRARIAEIGAIQ